MYLLKKSSDILSLMETLMSWLDVTQGLAQWLSVFAIAVVGYFAYKIEKEQFESSGEPHLFLEIVEMQKEEPRYDPKNRKWEILIKSASISRHVRLMKYCFSGEPAQLIGTKGALIPPNGNGFYPIPMSEGDIKDIIKADDPHRFLKITFHGRDGKLYGARYIISYNKDMASWYWGKVESEEDN